MIRVKDFHFNEFQTRCCVISDESGECVITDPGYRSGKERDSLVDYISGNALKPVRILLTHGHFDHILGLDDCAATYGIPVSMHPADKIILKSNTRFGAMFGLDVPETASVTEDIADGDIIRFGNTEFEVIFTPGHTPGGVCYYDRKDKLLISGDTLFAGTIGRTDHEGGDYDRLMESIFTRLMDLDGDVRVLPGHGPETTIADERTKNPFLLPFNLPEENEDDEEWSGNDGNDEE